MEGLGDSFGTFDCNGNVDYKCGQRYQIMTDQKKPKVGRPLAFDRADEIYGLTEMYVTSRAAMKKPMNVIDYALFLGFNSKQKLYEYAQREEFHDALTQGLSIVEEGHVDRVARGLADRGNQFLLKAHYQYTETHKVEHEGMTVIIQGKDSQL